MMKEKVAYFVKCFFSFQTEKAQSLGMVFLNSSCVTLGNNYFWSEEKKYICTAWTGKWWKKSHQNQ